MKRSLVVLISGLPGTGKTTLAADLGQRLRAVVLSRDQARQEIGGRPMVRDRYFTRMSGRYRRGLRKEASRRLEQAVADELYAGRPVSSK